MKEKIPQVMKDLTKSQKVELAAVMRSLINRGKSMPDTDQLWAQGIPRSYRS